MRIDELNTQEQSDQDDYDEYSSATSPDQIQGIIDYVDQKAEEDSGLSDVEVRLEEANCFKALLRNPLFDPDAGPIARKVEERIRSYIKQELKILLGLDSPKAKAPEPILSVFNSEELKALKLLAAKILSKPVIQDKPKEFNITPAKVEPLPTIPQVNVSKVKVPVQAPPAPVKPKGRPPKAKEDGKIVRPPGQKTMKKRVTIAGKEMEVEVGVDTGQVKPPAGTPGYMPTLTGDESVAVQARMEATRPKPSGLLSLAVNHAVKNATEE